MNLIICMMKPNCWLFISARIVEGRSMTELSQDYFDNKREQAEIAVAVLKAIPKNACYHNLIISFAEMLAQFTNQAFKEEVFGRSEEEDG